MKRIILLLTICLLFITNSNAQRKKVGLVLSGGGAKGVAHVGVIKVLEEAGIPIDYIAGTSMGSIIGALYAIGYNAHELDSLIRKQNWEFLLSDKVYRSDQPFNMKLFDETYILSLPFNNKKKLTLPAGVVQGQNIYSLFTELTVGYHDSLDFSKLPIPFACVATDMVSANEYVIKSGNLPLAMRASMAIPGVFTPVKIRDKVLVDGGIVNNFPVDVVKSMGADIIIGVDLETSTEKLKSLNSMTELIGQMISYMGSKSYKKNMQEVDLYLNPGLQGFTAASFGSKEIDTMILKGERIAKDHWKEILALKKKIGIDIKSDYSSKIFNSIVHDDSINIRNIIFKNSTGEGKKWAKNQINIRPNTRISRDDLGKIVNKLYATGLFSKVTYKLVGTNYKDMLIDMQEKSRSSANIGFRFDSHDAASILLNTTLKRKSFGASLFALTARLSKNPYFRIDYSFGKSILNNIHVSLKLRYFDFNIYKKGEKIDNVTYYNNDIRFNITNIIWRNIQTNFGLSMDFYNNFSSLSEYDSKFKDMKRKLYLNYFGTFHFDTFDSKYFPERGVQFKAEYHLITDDFVQLNNSSPISIFLFDVRGAIKLTRRVFLIPSLKSRYVSGTNSDIPFPYINYIGGNIDGKYTPQQIPFVGMNNVEIADRLVITGKAILRYRLGVNHYLRLIVNSGISNKDFSNLENGRFLMGYGLGYSYRTLLGPLGITLSDCNQKGKLGVFFFFGYNF